MPLDTDICVTLCRYTKYLYPLECKNNSFSNPNDLQSAIEGNKREGRTSSFGPYGGMPMQNSPLPPSLGGGIPFSMMTTMSTMSTPPRPLHMNGNRPPLHPGESLPASSWLGGWCGYLGGQIHLEFQSGIVYRVIIGGKIIAITANNWHFSQLQFGHHSIYQLEIDWNVPYRWTILVKSSLETGKLWPSDNFSPMINSHAVNITGSTFLCLSIVVAASFPQIRSIW